MDGAVISLLAPWLGLIEGILKGKEGRDEVKNLDTMREISRRISRETSELAYSWDSDVVGKTEIVDDKETVD